MMKIGHISSCKFFFRPALDGDMEFGYNEGGMNAGCGAGEELSRSSAPA